MEQRRQTRGNHPTVSWLSCMAVGVGVAFACTACSREDSSPSAKTKSGSGPIGYATSGGGGGGGALGGGGSSGGGSGDALALGGDASGGGSGGALARPSEAWTELTHKSRSGPLGPGDDSYSQTTVDVPQDLTDTLGKYGTAPGDDLGALGAQIGPLDETLDASTAPLPSTALAGLGLLVGLTVMLLGRQQRRLRRATVAVHPANSTTHQTGPR